MTKRSLLFKIIGICLCTLPAAIATLAHFPLWLGEERTAVSALSVAVLALCAIPFRRVLKRVFRSPSAWQLWLVLWILLSVLNPIIVGLRAVCAVACPSSLLGAVFFRLARKKP